MPAVNGTSLTLRRPDDFHLHVRDGSSLPSVVPHTAREFARAVIMPNLKPPVTTTEQARGYRERIMAAVPAGISFEPLMTLYLTDRTTPEEVKRAKDSGFIVGFKLYPAGATTNSDAGVTNIDRIVFVLEAMEMYDVALLVHAEVTSPDVDIFDREKVFIDRHLHPISINFPSLRIVFEHVTSAFGIQFLLNSRANVAGTITAHHLLMNRNDIFAGGLNPHHYCMPVLKSEADRRALMLAATSGDPRFFAGTDSAPHPVKSKGAYASAGIYTAHAAMELYAEAFDQADALHRLESFTSEFGARFYGLAPNEGTIQLIKEDTHVPADFPLGEDRVVPMRGGGVVPWRLA